MNASFRHLGWSTLALFALVGCETSPTPVPPATTPAPAPGSTDKNDIKSMPVDPAKPEAKGATSSAEPKLSDGEIAEIKKLPADEQPIAMAQMTCPVSGGKLGAMDMPVKQVVDGKTFFLCCSECEDKVKADPAAVLAKLKK